MLLELEAQRLHEKTLVVVMGDHGFALGEHDVRAWHVLRGRLVLII